MQIGSYQVLFELARGGMGTVYLARARGVGGVERLVAIKRAHSTLQWSPALAGRFLDEARIAAQVHHANVVGMHQAGQDDQGYYLVLDYVEGASLGGLVERAAQSNRRVPLPIALRIVLDALAGLHAVHQTCDAAGAPLGILHRDVSTQNLLVGRDGVTRLSDFGIAKSTLSSVITDQGYLQGKLVYMAPEYLRRQPVDVTLDVYAMGITLFTALSGRHPWDGKDQVEILDAIQRSGVPMLSATGTYVSSLLESIVMRACDPEPRRRFQSAREMLDALERAGNELGELARHVEVAEYVEAEVGKELLERRSLLRQFGELVTEASREMPLASPKRRVEVDQDSFTLGEIGVVPASTRPRRVRTFVYSALAALALGVGLAVLLTPRAEHAAASEENRHVESDALRANESAENRAEAARAPGVAPLDIETQKALIAPVPEAASANPNAQPGALAPASRTNTRASSLGVRREPSVSLHSISTLNPYR